MTQHLLTTKIQVPPLPLQSVQRERLLVALDRGLQPTTRVTLISAPAGYGKTTLLSDWLQKRDLVVAWLSISEGDNDVARFMSYLLATAARAGVASSAAAVELIEGGSFEGSRSEETLKERFLIPLINQIGRLSKQMVFAFDDYHLIRNQTVYSLTGYLIENLPPHAHVYIATRADPLLPITRLRGRGQVNELRLEDLRFRADETEIFLNTLSGLGLAPDSVHALQRKTEGWISGLQMTAAYLRGQEDTEAFIQSFSGSHHYIMDYLFDEVLRREPQGLQTFLLETSILEQLCGPLCDAVRSGAAGDLSLQPPGDGRQILRELEQANLFIVPLDERREWYRYHRLFAGLLQAHLQEKDADRVPVLHRRASVWFAEHGYVDDAVRHALLSAENASFGEEGSSNAEGSNEAFAAETVERFAQDILLRSETATFLRLVQRLPDEQIRKRPKLSIYYAWALLLQGAPLGLVQEQIKGGQAQQGPPGSSHSLEAFILLSQGQIEPALQLAQQALELLPAEEIFLRNFAAICAGGCLISLGHVEDGVRVMEQTAQHAGRSENHMATILILCELAELRQKQMQMDAAEDLYRRALETATKRDGTMLPIAGHAMMGLGSISLERYELDTAEQQLRDGIELAERWSLVNTLDGNFSLAMLYDARESAGAVHEPYLQKTLKALHDLARRFDASEFDDIIVELIAMRVNLRKGHLEAVREWVHGRGLEQMPAEKPAYYGSGSMLDRIYKYELPIVARWYLAEARYQDSFDVLQELANLAEEAGRPFLLLESYILQAKGHHLLGNSESALKVLKQALDIAAPQQSRRVFLVEGNIIVQLLEAGRLEWTDPRTLAFVDSLLGRLPDRAAGSRSSEPAEWAEGEPEEPLSPRELEVLRLLPSGLSAVELADELLISANTLRSHLKSIYAKLDVHSRHEAIVKAAELGLL
ncbi:MAG: LuxR C-terminal-related transcriptional regulator [Candidatus Promineifilaceae bacterium]